MAKNYYKDKEHAFLTIEKDLKSGKIPNVVLLCGSEDYLINWYTDVIIKKYINEACRAIDLTILEDDALSFQKIKECLETVSIMSERKIVLIPDFLAAEGKKMKKFPDAEVKSLAEYMADIPEESMLLMYVYEQEDGKHDSNNLIRTAAAEYGKVYDFQALKDRQLYGFIDKRLKNSGKAYTPAVVNMIISDSGYGNKSVEYSLYNLDNDIKKIIAHSTDGEISLRDVGSVLSVSPENNVFAMLDAVGRNKKDEAFRLLHNLLESGTNAYQLLKLITGQLELILSIKEMKSEGLSLEQIGKKLSVHQFRVKKAADIAGRCSLVYLKSILSEAYNVDGNIKMGIFEAPLALEYFIARL